MVLGLVEILQHGSFSLEILQEIRLVGTVT